MATNDRKLEAATVALTMLLPRLTDSDSHDVEQCIKLVKEVRRDLRKQEGRKGAGTWL